MKFSLISKYLLMISCRFKVYKNLIKKIKIQKIFTENFYQEMKDHKLDLSINN
jgi:hypothetical protein